MTMQPSELYRSRFEKWDSESWVRAKDRRATPFAQERYFFSRSLSIFFQHPEVAVLPDDIARSLLIYQLYLYLEFTVWLELGPVNEVCNLVRKPEFLPWLPAKMKDDALKVYVDEGGHAEMCRELIVATTQYTKITPIRVQPAFITILDSVVSREDVLMHDLIKLFFVIISETLITGTLAQLPRDVTLQEAVRSVVDDHAKDEGRHHAYFKQVFEFVWPKLPRAFQEKIGCLLPEMILAFLAPDVRSIENILGAFPTVFPDPARISTEISRDRGTLESIRNSASPTLRMLSLNHVFRIARVREAFLTCGLVPELS